jgi:DUF1680 family protein
MCSLFLSALLLACGESNNMKVQDVFEPLPPQAVRLNGYLDNYIQTSQQNWSKATVPYSFLANFFREGRPFLATGEMWGKAVRSGAMFYRYTQDPELKSLLDETVEDMLSLQYPDGSISCTPPEKQPSGSEGDLWERKYVMLGMEDYYEWVNPDPAVLESLKKQVDNIIGLVGHAPKIEITDLGWSAENVGIDEKSNIESSAILEPVMRLYKWTGEQRFLDFATYIIESGGTKHYNLFDQAYNNVAPKDMAGRYPKAYEMMSIFEGLIEYYRVTGDPKWKQSILNLYHNIREKEITLVGNAGANHPFHPTMGCEAWDNLAFEQTNPIIDRMMETCVGVTWLKFCCQIVRLTGNPAPIDDIEKYVYNGLIGSMKPDGKDFGYGNMLNGQKVDPNGWGWWHGAQHLTCCNLNGPMGLAYIPYVAVMQTTSGPVVNLYQSGEVTTETPRHRHVTLTIDGNFPVSENVKVKLTIEKPETFTISLRIPTWSEHTGLKINGDPETATPGTYADIKREWKDGDIIDLTFDMRCHLIEAPKGSNRAGDNFVALVRGPVVLARDQHIDPLFNEPIDVVQENGYVNIEPETDSVMRYRVPLTNGEYVTVVDYASVDNWDGTHICTWLPKKTVDVHK